MTYLFVGIYTWFGSVCIWSDSNGRQTRAGTKACQLQTKQIQNIFFYKYNERLERSKNTRKGSLWQNWKRESLGGCNNLHKFPEESYVYNYIGLNVFLTETCWYGWCWHRIKTKFALQLSINVIKPILHCFVYPNMEEAWSHRLVLKLDFGHWMILDSGPISPWVHMRAIERSKKEKQMGLKQL